MTPVPAGTAAASLAPLGPEPLERRVDVVARAPRLLVACDYDGVLAPIASDPPQARPLEGVVGTLHDLAAVAQTDVAIVSGRALDDLRRSIGEPGRFYLVGEHGHEVQGEDVRRAGGAEPFPESVVAAVKELASEAAGFRHQIKPRGIALHYRGVPAAEAATAVQRIIDLVATPAHLHVRHGKSVVEFSTAAASKGLALAGLRRLTGASAVVYLGDDVTDEDALAELSPTDLGVRVGEGESRAEFRLGSPEAARDLLRSILERRRAWDHETRQPGITTHSILSDQRALALVGERGALVWLCAPRADSPALFASLLGGPPAGYFAVRPAAECGRPRQAYVGDSFILETVWPGLTVIDYMECTGGRPYQRAGRTDLIRVLEGSGRAVLEFAPRVNFGRTRTILSARPDGLIVEGGQDPMALRSPGVAWHVVESGLHHTAVADVELSPGSPLVLELRSGTQSTREAVLPESGRRSHTQRFWSVWAEALRVPAGAPHDAVRRSALALKALCYGPTGALHAAGTTSLPEWPGGARNWDYRYCWVRDAAMAAAALVRLGSTGVAMRYVDWLLGVLDRCTAPECLRPTYSVVGSEPGPEAEIGELAGYRGSRPVRVFNAAVDQVQLDVFGPVVALVADLARAGAAPAPDHWRLVEGMVTAVARRWREPDHGIWEIRTGRRHHVHSKAMSWMAVDRAIWLADHLLAVRRPEWEALRDEIASDLLENGWDAGLGGFVAAYDLREPDAAALLVGLCGLVPCDDPRFLGTIALVERELLRGPTVYRYRYDDGLTGREGGFHLCTGWLVEACARSGRVREAEELFGRMLALVGTTGLLSEQYCPRDGIALGNFPQAYSHVALINAAVALAEARGEAPP